jgi:hypothetical protein
MGNPVQADDQQLVARLGDGPYLEAGSGPPATALLHEGVAMLEDRFGDFLAHH